MRVLSNKRKYQAGFSLVELSIVLVILGLVIGGVLTGKSLIRAAELRGVTTDYQRFVAATQIFNEKYQALPGDITNATEFWGTAAACPGTHLQPSTDARTCNGNGNGMVFGETPSSNESYRFWQHLANAGLISGTYSGVTGGAVNANTSIAANSPSGKASNQLWFVWHWPTVASIAGQGWFQRDYGNRLSVGSAFPNAEPWGVGNPAEMLGIDIKLDDGKPATGKVMVHPADCTDATSNTDFESDYLVTASDVTCLLMFPSAF